MTARATNRRRRTTRGVLHDNPIAIGAVIAATLIALTLIAALSANGVPGVPRYRLSTTLPRDAPTVREGSEVRVGGLVMGLVTDVAPSDAGQRVKFAIKKLASPVGRDVRITVRLKSPAGQHYLALDRGRYGRDPLPNGAVVPPSRVGRTEDLLDVISGFDRVALANLAATTRFTGTGFADRGRALNSSLAGLDLTARRLTDLANAATPGDDATGLLRESGRTARGFAGLRPLDTGRLTTASAQTFQAFGARAAAIGAGFRELRPAENELQATLPVADRTLAATTTLARRLTPSIRALRQALPDLNALFDQGGVLRDESGRLAQAGVGPLSRLAPIVDRFAPSAQMLGLAFEPLGPVGAYLAQYGRELESGFAAFYGATTYLNAAGQAPNTPAAPAMLILTCATGSNTNPAPGQLFRDRLPKPCTT